MDHWLSMKTLSSQPVLYTDATQCCTAMLNSRTLGCRHWNVWLHVQLAWPLNTPRGYQFTTIYPDQWNIGVHPQLPEHGLALWCDTKWFCCHNTKFQQHSSRKLYRHYWGIQGGGFSIPLNKSWVESCCRAVLDRWNFPNCVGALDETTYSQKKPNSCGLGSMCVLAQWWGIRPNNFNIFNLLFFTKNILPYTLYKTIQYMHSPTHLCTHILHGRMVLANLPKILRFSFKWSLFKCNSPFSDPLALIMKHFIPHMWYKNT